MIATGNGTAFIFNSIKDFCSDHAKIYIFSVLADQIQNHHLTENYFHITSCAKLRIPIIESEKLPPEDIFPSTSSLASFRNVICHSGTVYRNELNFVENFLVKFCHYRKKHYLCRNLK